MPRVIKDRRNEARPPKNPVVVVCCLRCGSLTANLGKECTKCLNGVLPLSKQKKS